jgi:hypothetical protein
VGPTSETTKPEPSSAQPPAKKRPQIKRPEEEDQQLWH